MFKAPPRSCWHIPRGRLIVRCRCDSFSGGATVHFFVALGCKLFNFFFQRIASICKYNVPESRRRCELYNWIENSACDIFLFRRRNRIIYLPCLYPFCSSEKKKKKQLKWVLKKRVSWSFQKSQILNVHLDEFFCAFKRFHRYSWWLWYDWIVVLYHPPAIFFVFVPSF